jgi:hypothetical protein
MVKLLQNRVSRWLQDRFNSVAARWQAVAMPRFCAARVLAWPKRSQGILALFRVSTKHNKKMRFSQNSRYDDSTGSCTMAL